MKEKSTTHNIRILPAKKIDRDKWDACVHSDHSATIYSTTRCLDTFCETWVGLLVDDYKAVMAIPVKKKLLFEMVYMPPFIQRLGLAGNYNSEMIASAGSHLQQFSRILQYASPHENLLPQAGIVRRTNYIIPAAPYKEIANNYTGSCKKNLRQSVTRGCVFADEVSFSEVLDCYIAAYGSKTGYTNLHFQLLRNFYEKLKSSGSAFTAGVKDPSGALVYAGLLLQDKHRIYYLLGAPTTEGRQMRATYFFVDTMIRRAADSGRIFDFEGSDIPDVARFYLSFSPTPEYYFRHYLNSWPAPVKGLIDKKLGTF